MCARIRRTLPELPTLGALEVEESTQNEDRLFDDDVRARGRVRMKIQGVRKLWTCTRACTWPGTWGLDRNALAPGADAWIIDDGSACVLLIDPLNIVSEGPGGYVCDELGLISVRGVCALIVAILLLVSDRDL